MQVQLIKRRVRAAIAILPILLASAMVNAQNTSGSSEYLIKAGFIYNFANLVQWPSSSFAQSDSPIVIVILGEDHFGPTIDHALDGKKVNARSFVIKRARSVSELQRVLGPQKECQILYVSSSEMPHLNEAIQMLKGVPVLTIGETPGFAKSGGIINLILEDNKVRFEVNVAAAKEADLNISSRLLALARIVQSSPSESRRAE
jgi:YfiR/HmsC-like